MKKRVKAGDGRHRNKGGSRKGIPNKATANAREAIARFVDGNCDRLQSWLDQIEKTEGAMAAWRCLVDVIEYHVPKLARTEHTGKDGERLTLMVDATIAKL